MQFLTALLAFAAIMALMSTIVAVAIEAIINVFGMRSSGLRRLLESYYRNAVAPRLPEDSGLSGSGQEARAFATAVTSNPAHQPGMLPAGPRRFNHLTTRQLVEQFARTNAGTAFLKLSDGELRPHLEALAYEFDRYSDGARDFFSRRTRFYSVGIALILAFALNIDALRLYRMLATDQAASQRIIALAQQSDDGSRLFALGSTATPTSDDGSAQPQQLVTTEAQLDELLAVIGAMNIPIGFTQYPYCSDYSPFLGLVTTDSAVYDKRCLRVTAYVDPTGPEAAAFAASSPQAESLISQWLPAAMDKTMLREVEARTHSDTALWLFSVLIAGGMIGLGAPFWFNVYRRLALLVPLVGAASALASGIRAQPTQGGQVAATPGPGRRDDANARGSDTLLIAARTAAGQSPEVAATSSESPSAAAVSAPAQAAVSSPPGAAIGAGSAQRVAAASVDAPAGEASEEFRMRRLRG